MPKAKEKLFVAVVVGELVGVISNRPEGDWASFVSHNKAVAIEDAIKARNKWQNKGFGPYRILVGTLGTEVTMPLSYEEVAL